MTDGGVLIKVDDGEFYVASKESGRQRYVPDSLFHDPRRALARAAELLGLNVDIVDRVPPGPSI